MRTCVPIFVLLLTATFLKAGPVDDALEKIGVKRGIVCLPGDYDPDFVIELAKASELTIFAQSADPDKTKTLQEKAASAKLLGTRVFAATGDPAEKIHLASNVADAVYFEKKTKLGTDEVMRVLRPLGKAFIPTGGDGGPLVKPVPDGYEDWSHPYHGPDNNPNSKDQFVKGDFRTQFINVPKFSPMPEQTVIGGGRMYKAMGHIAHKANQNEHLNTLLGVNAYNGTILWKRPLPEGFMIHRNTMIATEDALYLGDFESCKIYDGDTGEIRDEIVVPEGISDGPTWKWMAMQDGILYALVGNVEKKLETQKSIRRGLGHWPWGMWDGHDYNDPRTSFGYGRTLLAIDLKTKKPVWNYRDDEFLDARAVCMNDTQIFCYCPDKFIACISRETGKLLWKNSDKELLDAIGANEKAQHYITGYATTTYMKCTADYLFFAGPQRARMTVANAKGGSLAWTHPVGNLQLVLRDDAIYAAGAQNTEGGVKLDYKTGNVLANLPARRACTRATGCIDSIFFRAAGGTVRMLTETNTAQHIAPMRPPCQDGVLVSNGHLYWGPWMCGCQLSLYGNIGLAPRAELPTGPEIFSDSLVTFGDFEKVESLGADADDWTRYRRDDSRTGVTNVALPADVKLTWSAKVDSGDALVTAPVAAGGLVFTADRNGMVKAHAAADGELVWTNFTDGAVFYSPVISRDRLFVGAADGNVYAFEAKTGRKLWTFRVGPENRLIPIFGKLVSSWPIAGGVVADEASGTVYAAGGLTDYDGTMVVGLDAETGALKAQNTTSGVMSSEVNSGISMQGNLKIVDGELQFLGGGVYEVARYDLKNLAVLNQPKVQIKSDFRTAFYPWYPNYGKYVSLEHTLADGKILNHDSNYEGLYFTPISLQETGGARPRKDRAGEFIRNQSRRRNDAPPAPKEIWKDEENRRFTSFIVSEKSGGLLGTGHIDEKPDTAFLTSTKIKDGSDNWKMDLPAVPVKGGTAIDSQGRIFVVLENGELLCFGAK